MDLTQMKVEARTEIHHTALSRFERPHGRIPSKDQAAALAKLYRCPVSALYRKGSG